MLLFAYPPAPCRERTEEPEPQGRKGYCCFETTMEGLHGISERSFPPVGLWPCLQG